jgi:ABC-type multidrug transport system fused ATPase/permease subunit
MPDDVLAPTPEATTPKPLRRLLAYVWQPPRRIAAVVVLSFVGTFLAIVPAVLVGSISNGPIADGDTSALASALLVLLVIAVGGFLAMWFGGRLLAVAAQDAMYRLRRQVFEHTQTLSLRFFDRQPIGDLMSRITNDLDSVSQFFDKGLYPAINAVFTLVSTTVLMFIVSWQLSIAVVLIAPVILLMMNLTSRYSGPAFATLQERTGALNGAAEELITGDRTVEAYRVEALAIRKLEQLSEQAREAGTRANFVALTAMPLSAMLSNLDITLVALAGGWLSLRGTVDVGTVASFFIFARTFSRPLTSSPRSSTWRCRHARARPGSSRSSTRCPRSWTGPPPTTSPTSTVESTWSVSTSPTSLASRSCVTCASPPGRARRSASSARPAPARAPSSTSSPATTTSRRATSVSTTPASTT